MSSEMNSSGVEKTSAPNETKEDLNSSEKTNLTVNDYTCKDPMLLNGVNDTMDEKEKHAKEKEEEASKTMKLLNQEGEELQTSSDVYQVILGNIGSFGKWQWRLFFITSSCGLFTALHNLAAGECPHSSHRHTQN